jgi:hypothetical protein
VEAQGNNRKKPTDEVYITIIVLVDCFTRYAYTRKIEGNINSTKAWTAFDSIRKDAEATFGKFGKQGNRRPWLLHGRGFRYGATSKPDKAITSDQEIPWLSDCVVVGFVATVAVGQVAAMVALVATEPTSVATEPTLVAAEATLGVTKAAHADRFGLTTIPTFGAPLGRAISPL